MAGREALEMLHIARDSQISVYIHRQGLRARFNASAQVYVDDDSIIIICGMELWRA